MACFIKTIHVGRTEDNVPEGLDVKCTGQPMHFTSHQLLQVGDLGRAGKVTEFGGASR